MLFISLARAFAHDKHSNQTLDGTPKRLLAAGANLEAVSSAGDDVLTIAARFGNLPLLLLLADGDRAPPSRAKPATQNANGETALMLAVASGSVDAVAALTHMPGASLDAQNHQVRSPDDFLAPFPAGFLFFF